MEGSVANRGMRGVEVDAGSARRPRRVWRTLARVLVMLILSAGVLAAGVAGFRWMVATRPAVPMQAIGERPRAVEAVTVTLGRVQPTLTLYGLVAPARTVDLRALVAGEVVSVAPALVDGGRVRAGETLLAIERFDYEGALVRARADLAEAEARIAETEARIRQERDAERRAAEQAEIAQRETSRLDGLARRDFATEAQLDQSRTRLSAAQAARETRTNQIRVLAAQATRERATLDRLRWAVSKAERDLAATVLVAPFDGVVSNAGAEAGRIVGIQDRVATITDVARLDVRFTLSDAVFGRLAAEGPLQGREINVVWRGGGTVIEHPATIERIAPAVQANTGGVDVIARVTQAVDGPLRPGAFVEVTKLDRAFDDVARVPQSAITTGGLVFVVGDDQRLRAVPVRVVGYDGEHALINGDLPPGTRVMTTRLPDAGPGLLVTVRP